MKSLKNEAIGKIKRSEEWNGWQNDKVGKIKRSEESKSGEN
jgi:hypothetical protein